MKKIMHEVRTAPNRLSVSVAAVSEPESAAMISAYESVRPLSARERNYLPLLGRAAAIRIIATRLYDWLHQVDGAIVKPKDPRPYVRILKHFQANFA